MRLYALKISRNTRENRVCVHKIVPAPPGAVPYRLKRPKPYYAESLQIFRTKAEAEAVREAELVAAEFSEKSPEELKKQLREDVNRVAKFGITASTLCRITKMSQSTLEAYLHRYKNPNPRIVARFHLLAGEVERVANSAYSVLPDSGGCGNVRMARGGRKDIWKDQTRFRSPADGTDRVANSDD